MNTTKHIVGLMEAYTAVYDDELRDELDYEKELMEDDLSFIDDLSDNELVQVMEEILSEGEYTLDECLDIFDGVLISEATVTTAAGRKSRMASGRAKVTTSAGRRAEKTAERQGRVRMGRLAQAAERGAMYPINKTARATGYVAGKAFRATQAAGEKIQRAKERVKGFLGRVGRAAKAGASAARQEFSGQAGREAEQRTQARAARRAARKEPTDTSEFERKPVKMLPGASQRPALSGTPQRPALPSYRPRVDKVSVRDITGRPALPGRPQRIAISGTPQRTALPSVGMTKAGRPLTPAQRGMKAAQQNVKLRNRLGLGEDFDCILETILEDLIQEGYAYDIDEAFEILEDLTETEFDTLVESYLEDEVETLDFYDDVLDYLVSEGYAETEEDATAIMANMSEEWRDEILDEAQQIMSVSRGGKQIYKIPRSELHRPSNEPSSHKQKRMKQLARAKRNADRRGEESPARERQFDRFVSGTDTPLNRIRTSNIKKLNAPEELEYNPDPYRTVRTDYAARRRRASGR